MNASNRRPSTRVDDTAPVKPPAPAPNRRAGAVETPPTGPGPTKTDRAPKRTSSTTRAKVAFERSNGRAEVADLGDQVTRRAARAGRQAESYVRMRVQVKDGQLRVADSHLVDGPLGQTPNLSALNVYEVSLGDRLLHAGAIPDLGVQRSFVNPDGPPSERGHHLAERPVTEFMARVPAHELTAETIGSITVRLHRVKEPLTHARVGAAPLADQFERQIRHVAELVGLPRSVLPDQIEARGGRTGRGTDT